MEYGDYEDGFYGEPSEFEQKVEELKQALRESIVASTKDELEKLRKENARLSATESEMLETTRQYKRELADLDQRKGNLKREVEDEFYKAKLSDVVERIIERRVVWNAERIELARPKCSLCNAERKLKAVFPDGTETEKRCECAGIDYEWQPAISELKSISVQKRDSNYRSEQFFRLTKSYEASEDSRRRYNDYDHDDFYIGHVVDEFCDETKQLHKDKRYSESIGFTTEVECQKYCDWLNEKENRS